jgi:hypothetical protein
METPRDKDAPPAKAPTLVYICGGMTSEKASTDYSVYHLVQAVD